MASVYLFSIRCKFLHSTLEPGLKPAPMKDIISVGTCDAEH